MPQNQQKQEKKRLHVTHVNIRMSISFLLLKLIAIDILMVLVASVVFIFVENASFVDDKYELITSYGLLSIVLFTLFHLIFMMYVVLEWINEYYEVTPHAVVHKKGVIFKKEERYSFQNIKMISLDQGFFGKMLNYGTIVLLDWRLQKYTDLYLIHNPMKYMHIFEELLPNVDEERKEWRINLMEDKDRD